MIDAPVSPYCPRCLTRRNSYSGEAHFCLSCRDLYNRVFCEVVAEKAALKTLADKYQRYVGDCRPWRAAAELLLPLFALNRLALDATAFPRGDGTLVYPVVASAATTGPVYPLWAGNIELLSLCWPLTPRSLLRGLKHLREEAMIEAAGTSPYDPAIELWLVREPYRRPGLATELDAEKGVPVRGIPETRQVTSPSSRGLKVPAAV